MGVIIKLFLKFWYLSRLDDQLWALARDVTWRESLLWLLFGAFFSSAGRMLQAGYLFKPLRFFGELVTTYCEYCVAWGVIAALAWVLARLIGGQGGYGATTRAIALAFGMRAWGFFVFVPIPLFSRKLLDLAFLAIFVLAGGRAVETSQQLTQGRALVVFALALLSMGIVGLGLNVLTATFWPFPS